MFSVLLSLYYKEDPMYLDQSLESIFSQTLRADEIVLVEDGPLTPELYAVVNMYKKAYPELKLVALEKNNGLGMALNEGLRFCSYDLVVRADTDDICKPDRFEKLISYMVDHPEIDVCSSSIDEFEGDKDNVVSIRQLPQEHKDIFEFGKRRNPINHPASVFRKSAVEKVGGYQHFPLFEDYYLWVRMLMNGAIFHNIEESLLYFRISLEMIKRRGGWKYACTEMRFQKTMFSMGYISLLTMLTNLSLRFGVRILPNGARSFVYSKFLRKNH